MDSLQKEKLELWQQAEERLEQGHNPEPDNAERILQILILPTFGNFLSIEVLKRKQYGTAQFPQYQYFAVWIMWCKDTDYAKLENPVVRLKYPYPLKPTYEAYVVELETAFVEEIQSKIYDLPKDTVLYRGIVIDGTIAKLLIGYERQYEWYYHAQVADSFDQIVDSVVGYVKRYIPG